MSSGKQRAERDVRETPEVFSLSGINYQCYRAGQSVGIGAALTDAAKNAEVLNRQYSQQLVSLATDLLTALPQDHPLRSRVMSMAQSPRMLEEMSKQLAAKANEHKEASNRIIMEIQSQGVGLPWWRSRVFLALVGYITAVVLATGFASVLVFYLTRP